jgi:hypothetical protein
MIQQKFNTPSGPDYLAPLYFFKNPLEISDSLSTRSPLAPLPTRSLPAFSVCRRSCLRRPVSAQSSSLPSLTPPRSDRSSPPLSFPRHRLPTAVSICSSFPLRKLGFFSRADQLDPSLAVLLSLDAKLVLEPSLPGRTWRRQIPGSISSFDWLEAEVWRRFLGGATAQHVPGGGRSRVVPPSYQLERICKGTARQRLCNTAVHRLASASIADTSQKVNSFQPLLLPWAFDFLLVKLCKAHSSNYSLEPTSNPVISVTTCLSRLLL